jgi:hypothetical protein
MDIDNNQLLVMVLLACDYQNIEAVFAATFNFKWSVYNLWAKKSKKF